MDGGYDEIYMSSCCVWGEEPGSLFRGFTLRNREVCGAKVLDVGCGEGKNAIHFARLGAHVEAFDISELALHNALSAWPDAHLVRWKRCSVNEWVWEPNRFDLIIAYGLLHCLASPDDIFKIVKCMQHATTPGGSNVICAFNSRSQDLHAHPTLHPTLLSHTELSDLYHGWQLDVCTDNDLWETHPHCEHTHCHSLTRIIARKPM